MDRFVLHPVKRRDWTSGRRNIEGVIVASISIVCPSASTRSLTRLASDFGNVHVRPPSVDSVDLQRGQNMRGSNYINTEANEKLREVTNWARKS